MRFNSFFLFVVLVMIVGCTSSHDDYTAVPPQTPVVMDLTQVPYPKLSDYKFFDGALKNLNPSYGVLPYKPASSLFTDYAKKKRFVWMPNGTKASYNGDGNILSFPVGTALIKTFYYDNVQPLNVTQIIETRVMIKKATGWIVAEYIWNQDQTEAIFQASGAGDTVPISWIDEHNVTKNVNYSIPSTIDCEVCHKINNQDIPIGLKPQNLNNNYAYPEGSKNQLAKLISFGYLENNLPATIVSTVDYDDTTQPLNLRVRSYFDINCAHCHQDGGYASYYVMRFAFNQTTVAANLGICQMPNHSIPAVSGSIVKPSDINRSVLYYRVSTTDPGYRMPFKGRTIVHEEGVQLIADWINSLTSCD